MKFLILILFCLLHMVAGCQEKDTTKRAITEDDLININRKLVNRDADRIKAYLKSQDLDMSETQTGLWFTIDDSGKKVRAKKGQIISLKYDLSLLDGTMLYSSDSLGLKEFRIGQGGVESGLEEGVLMLGLGSKAKFILPPHLAHGLIGDDNQVGSRAILLYNVEVVDLK